MVPHKGVALHTAVDRPAGRHVDRPVRPRRAPYGVPMVPEVTVPALAVDADSMAPDVRELFDAAVAVQANAHAPYSNFRVGAAVRSGSGRVYAGCNVENAAYPQGSCAEAGAISAMVAAGDREIVAVLTVCDGEQVGTCCGGCRQRIREFADGPTPIYAAGARGVLATFTLDELLPASFGPGHLTLQSDVPTSRDRVPTLRDDVPT